MRTAVELLNVTCYKTLSGDTDEIRLAFNGNPILSAHIESGQTAPVNVIKDASGAKAIISLWQKESSTRTTTCIGKAHVLTDTTDTAEFSYEDPHYALKYRRAEVSDSAGPTRSSPDMRTHIAVSKTPP